MGAATKEQRALVKQYASRGDQVYSGLQMRFDSQRDVSAFLLRAGIDGIQYDAGTLSGTKSEARNYVVFDDNAISIESKEQFQKGKSDEPLGGKTDKEPVRQGSGERVEAKEGSQAEPERRREDVRNQSALQGAVERDLGRKLPPDAYKIESTPKTAEHKIAEKIAKSVFGKDVVWFSESAEAGGKGYNLGGCVIPGHEGKLFINVKTKKPAIVSVVHEALHLLKREHRDLYAPLAQAMVEEATGEFQKRGHEMMKLGYQPQHVLEELVSELGGEAFRQDSFLGRLRARSPKAFGKLVEIMQRLTEKAQAYLGKEKIEGSEKYFRDFGRVHDVLADAVAGARERVQGEGRMAAQRFSKEGPQPEDKPFPKELLAELEKAALRDRGTGDQWEKQYPMKAWVEEIKKGSEFWTVQIPEKAQKIIKSFGYDGIKELGLKGEKDRSKRQINWIAFDEKGQIKSAIGNRGAYDPTKADFSMQREATDFEQYDLWGNAIAGKDIEAEQDFRKKFNIEKNEVFDYPGFHEWMNEQMGQIRYARDFDSMKPKDQRYWVDAFKAKKESEKLAAIKKGPLVTEFEKLQAEKGKTKDLDVSDLPLFDGGRDLFDALFQKEGPTEEAKDLIKQAKYKSPRVFDRDFGRHSLEEHGETKGEYLRRVICGGRP